ncbi:Putative inner dynein arm light chain, axonemal [Papilio machaon]|uniref:Putative inner dynein arm light chain, axonemal n=1 Tax=Papilio machaon TaxID=76193 RepID=A0A194RNM3_PAPMA|nr:Putative inner dynein arm light chain, axonemal [Papilio machaon]
MAERITTTAEDTLVRYDNPVLVSKKAEAIPSPRGDAIEPCVPTEAKRETEEILNAILPPKEWEEDGQIWTQKISSTPATRLDVINLQELLDTRLQQRQARETGICPVRRQLYTQCFDELIRQVTINCGERGLLLLRVRDEARITMEAYQTLYCSSIAFGMRKALQSEQGKSDLLDQVAKLESERSSLEKLCAELKQKTEQLERRAAELRAAEEKRHQEELLALKKTNAQLKISSTPATRLDVINLQELLDTRLQQRQARETGICPVRRQLYTQCFDELIRQVTINCGERGLLLLRVRDEARITMEAYQTLYCSSIAFGMRKALQSEQGKSDLLDQVAKLESERSSLEKLCAELKQKTEQLERRAAELRAAEEKRHQEELLALKKTNAQLKAQLEGIIAPKK